MQSILESNAMRWKDMFELVRDTIYGCSERQTLQLGAALAFQGVFALAPLLVIAIALAGIFFGEDAAKGQLDATLTEAVGPVMAKAIAETLTHVYYTQSGWTATLLGFGFVLFASTGMFVQLQLSLNAIWGVQPKPSWSFWSLLRGRFYAFVLVLGIGALLVLLLIAHALVTALHAHLPAGPWSDKPYLWEGMDWFSTLLLQTLFFAVIFKLLPDAIIAWRDVLVGALLTAPLFALGNLLFCQYVSWAALVSVYGPAGSLVVVMLWVYYSSQTLLFGAEFTKQFANKYGHPTRPANYAMCRS
jgi:membrane protein